MESADYDCESDESDSEGLVASADESARRLEGLDIELVPQPHGCGVVLRVPYGDFPDVTMHWTGGVVQTVRAKYAHSGVHRDRFVWHGSSQGYAGYAFERATEMAARNTIVPEAAAAATYCDVVLPLLRRVLPEVRHLPY